MPLYKAKIPFPTGYFTAGEIPLNIAFMSVSFSGFLRAVLNAQATNGNTVTFMF